MCFNDEELLDDKQARKIIYNIVADGRAGFFSWDIDNQSFNAVEKITGKNLENINTLPDFINEIAYHKDKRSTLEDVELFLESDQPYYESTFRIINNKNEIRWVFCKGTLMEDNTLEVFMYDVSRNRFKPGHAWSTNLINIPTFMHKLKNSLARSEEHGKKGALLYLDISNFHIIINKYGFEIVDTIIYKLERLLLQYVGPTDEIGHFPYYKFMFLLNDLDSIEQVEQVSQAITHAFEQPFKVNGRNIYLKINMGITLFPRFSTDIDELIRFSDFALSQSREAGMNEPTFFDADLMAVYNRKLDIENELARAIIENELYLVYQPQLELKTNKIIGYEALVRWKNKNLGEVYPGEFIPVAEDNGYIVSIGRWVRERAVKTVRRWLDKGLDFEKVGVNVSSIEIMHRGFQEHLLKLCKKYHVDPELIELEVTERTMLAANEGSKDIMKELNDAGFKIAIDDFGVGYSNLSSLLNFEVNTLKLDKSFIDNINSDDRQIHLLKLIIASKEILFEHITAEGVEDDKTMRVLSDLGFDTIQGYYFSKPLPIYEMEKFTSSFNKSNM